MYKSIIATVACLVLTSAAPASPSCVDGYMAVTANFDDIKSPNQANDPKPGYAGLDWSKDAYVQRNPSTYNGSADPDSHPFAGSSLPHTLRAGSQHIAFQSDSASMFSLKSFALACYSYVSDASLKPEKCSFEVIVGGNYEPVNTYLFDYDASDDENPTFTTFKGPRNKGEVMQIQLVGRPVGKHPLKAGTVLVIDNVVTMQRC